MQGVRKHVNASSPRTLALLVHSHPAAVLAAVKDAARREAAVASGHPGLPLRATAECAVGRDEEAGAPAEPGSTSKPARRPKPPLADPINPIPWSSASAGKKI
jgi:hypothetical protein